MNGPKCNNHYRAVFIGHSIELAGAELALARFVMNLDRCRWSPSVILPREGPISAQFRASAVPIQIVPYRVLTAGKWTDSGVGREISQLRQAIVALAPDLIVVNTDVIPQATMAALSTLVPTVVHFHSLIDKVMYAVFESAVARSAGEMWLQFPESLIACSTWLCRVYGHWLDRPVTTVPNFCTVPPAPSAYPHAREVIPAVAMLATLEHNKRPDLFIMAAAKLHSMRPDLPFRCVLYGEGHPAYMRELRELAHALRVESFFTMLPRTDDARRAIEESAIVLVLSETESFSMVAIEAGASGRPVIATRCGGPEEIVVDGETGFLVERGNVEALVEKMELLLMDRALSERLGVAAHHHVKRNFSPEVVMPVYERALEDAILAGRNAENRARRRIAHPFIRYFMGHASQ